MVSVNMPFDDCYGAEVVDKKLNSRRPPILESAWRGNVCASGSRTGFGDVLEGGCGVIAGRDVVFELVVVSLHCVGIRYIEVAL
jgi:hypothetical protein